MKSIVSTVLLLLLSACSEQPSLPKLSGNAAILAFGDSITYGTGASAQHDYPNILAGMTGLKVINAGIPGEISSNGLLRLPALLDLHQPELLILIHGGNDMLRKTSQQQIVNNLESMIREAKQRKIAVIILGVPQPGLFLLSSAEIYQTLAVEQQIPADLDTLSFILTKNSMKSDLIHPNDQGYYLLAERIVSLLQDSGAL